MKTSAEVIPTMIERPALQKGIRQLLGKALDPSCSLAESAEAAQTVSATIGHILTGQLVVQPILSPQELGYYGDWSRGIISMEEKARNPQVANGRNRPRARQVVKLKNN